MNFGIRKFVVYNGSNLAIMENSFKIFPSGRKHFYWKGFGDEERHSTIYQIENIINQNGYIDDFHMFSDVAISLKINIEERYLEALHKELSGIIRLPELPVNELHSSVECTVFLNVTFTQSTGNLMIEVPAVPG